MINQKTKIGFIGLGLMGRPMCKQLLKNGFETFIKGHHQRSNIEELVGLGAKEVSTYEELAQSCQQIILMLPSSREVEDVALKQLGPHLKPFHLVIDMSTSDPRSTKHIFDQFQKTNLRFMDSPVTGGVKGAEEGTLTLFLGGPKPWIDEALPTLKAMSKLQSHFGPVSSGHTVKLINNIVCIGNIAVYSEILPYAVKFGLSAQQVFETVKSGTGQSWMLDFYGPQILEGDFKPRYRLTHALKDLNLAKEVIGDHLSVVDGCSELFKKAMDLGVKDENISALIKVSEETLDCQFRK